MLFGRLPVIDEIVVVSLDFLFQSIKLWGRKELRQRNIEPIADLLDR